MQSVVESFPGWHCSLRRCSAAPRFTSWVMGGISRLRKSLAHRPWPDAVPLAVMSDARSRSRSVCRCSVISYIEPDRVDRTMKHATTLAATSGSMI